MNYTNIMYILPVGKEKKCKKREDTECKNDLKTVREIDRICGSKNLRIQGSKDSRHASYIYMKESRDFSLFKDLEIRWT